MVRRGGVGRLRLRYSDDMSSDIRTLEIHSWRSQAQDREGWRHLRRLRLTMDCYTMTMTFLAACFIIFIKVNYKSSTESSV